jgi:hypothetical protein
MSADALCRLPADARRPRRLVIAVLTVGASSLMAAFFVVLAQQPELDELPRDESKFTLARVYFDVPAFSFRGPVGADSGPGWSHDWPRAEEHLMKILSEVTLLDVNPGGHVTSFQTDEIFKYPIAYLCEVGFMDLSEPELQRLRQYLLRGGFLIVDDFRESWALENFRRQLKTIFPERQLEEVPRSHEIWTCFYDITNVFPPSYGRQQPEYLGMSDDKGRLMMIVDYNGDISEHWEWSGDPFQPIEDSNQAFKYGVNYAVYALTH